MDLSSNQIRIIGTSHIAKQSIEEIKAAVDSYQPNIIAVELDLKRAYALTHEEKRKTPFSEILKIGWKGFLFVKIGQYLQEKLGRIVGIAPGSEMKTALKLAREKGLQVAFIDQPIEITLKNFSRTLTWKEKIRFVTDLFKGLIMPKKQIKAFGFESFDLSRVPEKEIISKAINQLRIHYPNVYKTLIQDRNKYMVKEIVQLLRKYPEKKILVVVGAGHREGMEQLLLKVEIVK